MYYIIDPAQLRSILQAHTKCAACTHVMLAYVAHK